MSHGTGTGFGSKVERQCKRQTVVGRGDVGNERPKETGGLGSHGK